MPDSSPLTTLDVRPILAGGGEPFGAIMEAVDGLPADGVLELVSPFDPVPLHGVLGKRGFARETRELGPAHFVTVYRRGAADDAWDGVRLDATPAPEASAAAEVVLDVRGLTPPEPMERTLAALEGLPAGTTLVQINDRVPAFLLPHLDERGYEYRIAEDDRGTVTTIRRVA